MSTVGFSAGTQCEAYRVRKKKFKIIQIRLKSRTLRVEVTRECGEGVGILVDERMGLSRAHPKRNRANTAGDELLSA